LTAAESVAEINRLESNLGNFGGSKARDTLLE